MDKKFKLTVEYFAAEDYKNPKLNKRLLQTLIGAGELTRDIALKNNKDLGISWVNSVWDDDDDISNAFLESEECRKELLAEIATAQASGIKLVGQGEMGYGDEACIVFFNCYEPQNKNKWLVNRIVKQCNS